MNPAFSAPELYLLAAAFGGQALFGLPEKNLLQIKGEEVFQKAHRRLIEKGILTSDGNITSTGALIIQVVEDYYRSDKYVRIHNLMFAFREKKSEEVILLIELEEMDQYQLKVVSKATALRILAERFPVIGREPNPKEQTFVREELSHHERHEIEQYEPNDMLMNLEFFHLNEEPQDRLNARYYQQWLIFTKDGKLIMVDTVNQKYYHASQYWFLKVLFDEMDFPYKEEVPYA